MNPNEHHPYIHDILRPFFPEWSDLRHMNGLDHDDQLSRMHIELLHVLASKKKLDLFEVASLLNIGHVSAAEMVDTLIEKGLVEASPVLSPKPLKISISSVLKPHFSRTSGLKSIGEVIHREKRNSKFPLLSKSMIAPKSTRKTTLQRKHEIQKKGR